VLEGVSVKKNLILLHLEAIIWAYKDKNLDLGLITSKGVISYYN
jgi:hypothetical protein